MEAKAPKTMTNSAGPRKSVPVYIEYHENDRLRTQSVSKRGATLKKLADEFMTRTGGRAFLKVQYRSIRGKLYEWSSGQDFQLLGDPYYRAESAPPISTSSMNPLSCVQIMDNSYGEDVGINSTPNLDSSKVAERSQESKKVLDDHIRTGLVCQNYEFGERSNENEWTIRSFNTVTDGPCPVSKDDLTPLPSRNNDTILLPTSVYSQSTSPNEEIDSDDNEDDGQEYQNQTIYDFGKLPSILGGTYFKVTTCSDDGTKVSAKCLKCPSATKQISGALNVTSNFVKHLKRKHQDDYIEFQDKQKQRIFEHRKKQTVISLNTNPGSSEYKPWSLGKVVGNYYGDGAVLNCTPNLDLVKAEKSEESKMDLNDTLVTCFVCSKLDVEFGERIYESGWIRCSFNKGSDDQCPASAHTDCIGFPGVIEEAEIEAMPDFYCPRHRQRGRALRNVNSSYL